MLINKDHAQHLLELYTAQDAESYKTKNIKAAIETAKKQLLKEAREQLLWIIEELQPEEEKRLKADWFADEIEEAERKEFTSFLEKCKLNFKEGNNALTQCSEKNYYYFLEVLPPIYIKNGFACSEPYSHTMTGPVHLCFYKKTEGVFFAKYEILNQSVTA